MDPLKRMKHYSVLAKGADAVISINADEMEETEKYFFFYIDNLLTASIPKAIVENIVTEGR